MSQQEWEERSLNFMTRMATTPVGESVWNRFGVKNTSEILLLQDEIRRALFANKKTLNEEDRILIRDIAQCCINNSEHKMIVDIAVVYACVRTEKPTSECIIPIFRLRNRSETPEKCNVIDHLGKHYIDLESYLKDNTWGPSWLMIPFDGQYTLNKNGICNIKIHDQTSNFNEVTFNRTSGIELTEEEIFTSITLAQQAQKAERAKQKKELNSEHHLKYDALREGYQESVRPGEVRKMHGDRKFISDMSVADNLNEYYENFVIKADGNFHINGVLTIHPRAYAQLPEDAKATIIETTKQLKNNEILYQDFGKRTQDICKDHRLKFDQQRAGYEKNLADNFEVSNLEDVRVGNQHIFANLKPSEIDRLHQVISDFVKDNIAYVKLGKDFATKMGVKNLTAYIATSEYIVRKVQKECRTRRRKNPNPVDRGDENVKEFYVKQVIDELQKNDLEDAKKSFLELMAVCGKAMEGYDRGFKNLYAAVNHYDKHNSLREFDKSNLVSPKTYFEIARDMTSVAYSEVKWTQDGSSLVCTYLSELRRTIAITFVSHPEKTEIIATLYDSGKTNEIVPSNYHYHPDY